VQAGMILEQKVAQLVRDRLTAMADGLNVKLKLRIAGTG
jgi:hypothetical protein